MMVVKMEEKCMDQALCLPRRSGGRLKEIPAEESHEKQT
jgi:NAD-dependent dihydropyrimidine dehydrogenase PreA subunit